MKLGKRALERLVCGAVVLQALGCSGGSSPTGPTPSPSNPRADLTDATGDAVYRCPTVGPGAACAGRVGTTPYDLVSATAESAGSMLIVNVRFAAGTYVAGGTDVGLHIDTDENAATGGGQSFQSGYEYFFLGAGLATTTLYRWNGTTIEQIAGSGSQITVEHVANGANIRIPLSLLGNDDGRLALRIFTDYGGGEAEDWMPNVGSATVRLQ